MDSGTSGYRKVSFLYDTVDMDSDGQKSRRVGQCRMHILIEAGNNLKTSTESHCDIQCATKAPKVTVRYLSFHIICFGGAIKSTMQNR
jgi:hypothetical protein